MSELALPCGSLPLPAFLPDATRAAVRCVDAGDLRAVGVPGVVVNTFHLMRRPGVRTIQRCGGIHRFMDWDGPVVSDSGGFQVYSLIRQNPDYGTIRPNEVIFREPDTGEKWRLSPERCIQLQFQLGSDVLFCLDDCTHADDPPEEQEASVERTVRWARRSKEAFERECAQRPGDRPRPLLFAVVQGGARDDLRRRCAEALVEIGFDGYGFGGWPMDNDGNLLLDPVKQVANLLPANAPKHALGIGSPGHVVAAARAGYTLFDCSLPTRDARRNRLHVFAHNPPALDGAFSDVLYILDARYRADAGPVDPNCDCPCCRHYSRAYLHHLFKVGDALAERLATLHNVRFYVRLMKALAQREPGPTRS